MNPFKPIWSGIRSLGQRRDLKREIDEELRFHLEQATAEKIATGMSPEAARCAALRQFGHVDGITETCREQRECFVSRQWSVVRRDLNFGLRQLRKSPGFTAVAIGTLALGIGATTAIVSVVRTAVFDPVPAANPERLVQFGKVRKEWGWLPGINAPALRDLRQETNLFARVAAHYWDVLTLPGEVFPQPIGGSWVTPEFFRLWSVRPLLGRTFSADEGHPSKNDVLVISHRLWRSQFGGDPAVVGRTVRFRERPMTVIGVMPPHFLFPESSSDYWRPVGDPDPVADELGPNIQVIAELRGDVETAQVQAFLEVVTERQAQNHARAFGGPFEFTFQVRDLREVFSTQEVRRTLTLLLGGVVFVLLIAAANVANLQLARAQTRQQELAVRAALGAGRARVIRQLLTESLLLAGLGGLLGLAVSVGSLDFLQKLIPAELPRLKPVALDTEMLLAAAVVTLTTGLLFGFAPACQGWRANLSGALKLGMATSTRDGGRTRFSRAVIAGQVAMVVVLLTAAGLMGRSVTELLRVNPGLDPKHVVRVYPHLLELQQRQFNPNLALNKAPEAAFAFFADARQRVAAIHGVTSVGVGFEGRESEIFTRPEAPAVRMLKFWIGVEADDPLRVMRVPLKKGRWLERGDAGGGVPSVIINESAARQLWPGQEAIGKRFVAREQNRSRPDLTCEVVGVVGDTRDYSKYITPQPTFYRALQKEPGVDVAPMFLVVRAAGEPGLLYKPICEALKAAGADFNMPQFINLHERLWNRMAGHRALMLYLGLFAGVGLGLAAIGLYGVLAYSVERRTREIGIRMALGGQRGDMLRLILAEGARLVCVGVAFGLLAAFWLTRFLQKQLFEVSPTDPVVFAGVVTLLLAVAALACLIPALRASRIAPMTALRYE